LPAAAHSLPETTEDGLQLREGDFSPGISLTSVNTTPLHKTYIQRLPLSGKMTFHSKSQEPLGTDSAPTTCRLPPLDANQYAQQLSSQPCFDRALNTCLESAFRLAKRSWLFS
jgi:hypothetical protein